MKTCPYCGTGVAVNGGSYYCGFCDMKGMVPTEDGARNERFKLKEFIDHDDFRKTTPELMTYHTVDLLRLLKLGREERRAFFHHISTFKKAGEDYKELAAETGNDYENITRKTWVIENILKDRIGYIPQKVTDALLVTVMDRAEQERNMKPMIIKKKEPEIKMER